MINLKITVDKNQIVTTDFHEKDLTLGEASMLIIEMEKIKLEILNKDFDKLLRVDE